MTFPRLIGSTVLSEASETQSGKLCTVYQVRCDGCGRVRKLRKSQVLCAVRGSGRLVCARCVRATRPARSTKRCQRCEGQSWRRPKSRPCDCGYLYAEEQVREVGPYSASSIVGDW